MVLILHKLTQESSYIYENNTNKDVARLQLAHWNNKIEISNYKSCNTNALQAYFELL